MDTQLYRRLMQYLSAGVFPPHSNPQEQAKLQAQSRYYLLDHDTLYKKNRYNPLQPLRVITIPEKTLILRSLHQDPHNGHAGVNATYSRAAEHYYWNNMYQDIRQFIQACDLCQRRGRVPLNRRSQAIPVADAFDRIGLDFVGPLPTTKKGNRYILVCTEYLTKWPEARAVPTVTAQDVSTFLIDEIVSRHGVPREILTDQGAHFENDLIKQFCIDLNIRKSRSTAYHPQTNGLFERYNRTLCEALARTCYQHKQDWDQYLRPALFAYRTLPHSATRHSPFFSFYGRKALLPHEWSFPTYRLQTSVSPRATAKILLKRAATLAPLI